MTRSFLQFLACFSLLTALAVAAPAQIASPLENGVLTLENGHIDDVLLLDKQPHISIVEIADGYGAVISSSHLFVLLRWVENGGTLWFHTDGFSSALFDKVNPGILITSYDFEKESGGPYEEGELFVRDLLPNISIGDHEITAGVQSLYVRPLFNGETIEIEDAAYTPIIWFTESESGIHQYDRLTMGQKHVLFAIVERGHGLIVVDATGIGRQDWTSESGHAYDAPRFFDNVRRFNNQSASSEKWVDGSARNVPQVAASFQVEGLNRTPVVAPAPITGSGEGIIRLRVTVTPAGDVTRIIRLRGADPALEKVAVETVEKWKFNPLPLNAPAENQTGIITFRFREE